MHKFNGSTTYDHRNPSYHEQIKMDACLEGMGGVWSNQVYTCSIPNGLKHYVEFSIRHFKMLNMLLVLILWGHRWQHKKIIFKVDNLAVVTVCNIGYTRCKHLAAIIRNI